ncbi:MAG: copper chaperone [Chloroflexota bacterium]|nr:MAG: copper chaperone [Chloroflexota bacterium]
MSAANVILSLIGTNIVKSLAIEAGKSLLTDFLANEGSGQIARRQCRHCPWGKNGRRADERRASEIVVPGRARVAVPGLQGNPGRAEEVEETLRHLPGVTKVQASHLTGRVLVLFDPALVDLPTISRAIRGDRIGVVVSLPAERELVGAAI